MAVDSIVKGLEPALAQITSILEQLSIADLPSAPMVSPDFNIFLPTATSAIYFIRSKSRGLMYIGRATNVRNRWRKATSWVRSDTICWEMCHHRFRDALKLKDCVLHWLPVPKPYLGVLEGLLIHYHKPPWNRA